MDGAWGGLTGIAQAAVERSATMDGAWGELVGSATALVDHSAVLDGAWGELLGSATATVEISATMSSEWGTLVGSATATVTGGGGSPGAITFVNSTSVAENAAATTTRTISQPAGLQANDFVIIFVWNNLTGNPAATVTPSGFTVGPRTIDGNLTQEVYYKVVTGSEPTWQIAYGTNSTKLNYYALAYRGVDTVNPIHSEAGQAESSTVTAHVTASINVSTAGCWLISAAAARNSAASTTWSGTDVERIDLQGTGTNPLDAMVQDSNGAISTGNGITRTLTSTASNGVATTYIGALKPASSSGSTVEFTASGAWGGLSGTIVAAPVRSATMDGAWGGMTGSATAEIWRTFDDGTSATTGATVTSLANGTPYYFRVAAVNSEGQAEWSNIAGPYTPSISGLGFWGVRA
jgi:hypothetical protein